MLVFEGGYWSGFVELWPIVADGFGDFVFTHWIIEKITGRTLGMLISDNLDGGEIWSGLVEFEPGADTRSKLHQLQRTEALGLTTGPATE